MSYAIAYFWNMSVYSIFLSVMGIFIFVYFAFIVFERCFLDDEQLLGFHNPLYQRVENSNEVTDGNGNLSNDANNGSIAIEMQALSGASQDPGQGK